MSLKSLNMDMEESRFKAICHVYVSSLFALALALPLASDGVFRSKFTKGLLDAFRGTSIRYERKYEELDRNRVHLAFDDLKAQRSSSMATIVVRAATKHRLDPALVKAVIHVESNYNPFSISPKGALGFMQLMPATARRLGVKNIHDPVQNIYGGSKYLRHLLDMFDNDVRLALAAYNAGPGKVRQYRGVPPYPETQKYVRNVMTAYRDYRKMYS